MKYCIYFFSFVLFCNFQIHAQTAPGKYWIQFTDKNNTPYSINSPDAFLSDRAISRRSKQNIAIIQNDLPIDPAYIDSIESYGVKVENISKWFNAITIDAVRDSIIDSTAYANADSLVDSLLQISFIKSVKKVKLFKKDTAYISLKSKSLHTSKTETSDNYYKYGLSENQISIINGHILHNNGNRGEGMQIAVLDGGFYHVNEITTFDSLWNNNRILGAKSFCGTPRITSVTVDFA